MKTKIMVKYLNLLCWGRKEVVLVNGWIIYCNFFHKFFNLFWHNCKEKNCNVSNISDEIILIRHVPYVTALWRNNLYFHETHECDNILPW
jgi:hypothetical protein